MCKHITLLLPNEPGRFYEVATWLADVNVNILGFSANSDGRAGILHLICSDHDIAYRILKEKYVHYCSEKEVVVIEIEHKPGMLKKILECLSQSKMNLSVSYQGFVSAENALIVMEFDNIYTLENAKKIFIENNFNVLNEIPS